MSQTTETTQTSRDQATDLQIDTSIKSGILKKPILQVIGVKPAESPVYEGLRLAAIIALIVYIVYMIYDDYEDDKIREEMMRKMFENDDNFYKKLATMDPEIRDKYLDAVKTSLDDNKNKKTNLFNTVKGALVAGTLSEFIVSGSSAKVMGVISKTLIYSSVSALT